jgi:pimeloyl-ACP methyl ester carboxylesterase
MKTIQHYAANGAGWQLSLTQTWSPDRLQRGKRPVLIVPGYGMNSFIFSYHPHGPSLEGYLVESGLEVWRADLRAQGGSIRTGGSDNFSLEDLALTDVSAAIRRVLEATHTGADRVDVIGGSLGGTLMFVHAVLERENRMASLVCLGSPVRWVKVHPLVKVAFVSPTLIGLVRFRGTRKLAQMTLPLLARWTPWLLSVYMNPEITDTRAASEMARTVENPNRHINRQIARWIRERDLVLRGVNVSEALAALRNPLLCVLATGDGIVPPETAAFPYTQIGSASKRLLEVGSRTIAMAHADLFVSSEAHDRVFAPIRDFLFDHAGPVAAERTEKGDPIG